MIDGTLAHPSSSTYRRAEKECLTTTTTTTKNRFEWNQRLQLTRKFAINREKDCYLPLLQLILNYLMMHIQTR